MPAPDRRLPFDADRSLPAAIVLAGVVLRVALFLANRSLFMDEAALQLSVRARPLAELVGQPLAFGQMAPAGYLVLQRTALVALGDHELAVRLLPLLASLAALLLFAALAYRALPRAGAHVAVALLALSNPAVYFASYAKPYALDLLGGVVALGAGWVLVRREGSARGAAAAGIAGAGVPWLSIPGAIAVAGVGGALVALDALRGSGREGAAGRGGRMAAVAAWAASAVGALAVAQAARTRTGAAYVERFWAAGFAPVPPRSIDDWAWLPRQAVLFAIDPLGSWVPVAMLVALPLGLAWMARRDRALLLLVLGPPAVALLASALRLYPLGGGIADFYPGRTSTFLVPGALLAAGASIPLLRERFGAASRVPAALAVALVILGGAPAAFAFVFPRDDVRQVLDGVRERARPGDALYVGYRARHVAEWYADRLPDGVEVVHGACIPYGSAGALGEVRKVAGRARAWLLFSHPYGPGERQVMREALDEVAAARDSVLARNASAHLYALPEALPGRFRVRAPVLRDVNCGTFYPAADRPAGTGDGGAEDRSSSGTETAAGAEAESGAGAGRGT